MDLLEDGKKQIFFFDDFLGNTFFEHGEKGFESKLILFIRHIRKAKDKLLILTTREYILQDAKLYCQQFDDFKNVADFFEFAARLMRR